MHVTPGPGHTGQGDQTERERQIPRDVDPSMPADWRLCHNVPQQGVAGVVSPHAFILLSRVL